MILEDIHGYTKKRHSLKLHSTAHCVTMSSLAPGVVVWDVPHHDRSLWAARPSFIGQEDMHQG